MFVVAFGRVGQLLEERPPTVVVTKARICGTSLSD